MGCKIGAKKQTASKLIDYGFILLSQYKRNKPNDY